MKEKKRVIAWHYTTGEKFFLIGSSGELQPSSIGVFYPEKPVLWFSTDQYWESTASKAIRDGEKIRTLSMEETFTHAGGLVRFGVPVTKLHHWNVLAKRAQISRDMTKNLELSGIQQGANPNQWYGSIKAISIEECLLEVMNKNLVWEKVNR